MKLPNAPVVYEINTWAWLDSLSEQAGQCVTLGTVPQAELERLAAYGFDALWLMGVWQRSPADRRIAREDAGLQVEYRAVLPDYQDDDVVGSPYSVYRYTVDPALGRDEELAALRERLNALGVGLILDFVPNHLAVDHPWLVEHPEYLVQGSTEDLARHPVTFFRSPADDHDRIFAYGRDPYYVWNDTVQLDYRRSETRQAMIDLLLQIAGRCDGARCDLAMLVTYDLFLNLWGGQFDPPGASVEFWVEAIERVKAAYPDFMMLAEVYWFQQDQKLQEQGFDYTYDKALYDFLGKPDLEALRSHLSAGLDYQRRTARFIENHDEQRAREVFGPERSRAAAMLALTLPGLRLIHEGQMDGWRLKLPVQLGRRPAEPSEPEMVQFYERLLAALHQPVFHEGQWSGLIQPRDPWVGSHRSFLAYLWRDDQEVRLIVVNLSSEPADCWLPLDLPALADHSWRLHDLLSDRAYVRDGNSLLNPGLYVKVPAYGFHLFELSEAPLPTPEARSGFEPRGALPARDKSICEMAWSPDGKLLASAGKDNLIWLWSVETGADVRRLEGHPKVVGCLAWSPDGQRLASGSDDRTIRLWTLEDGAPCRVMEGHHDNVLSLAWSPDGRLLASGSVDRFAMLWDVERRELLHRLGGHTEAVNCVRWSPDGATLASGSGDQRIQLWDTATWKPRLDIQARDWISSIAWSPDSKLLAGGTGGGTVDIWEAETGRLIAMCEGHTSRVLCVAFSADGRLLASKAADGTIRFWQSDSWAPVATMEERGVYLGGLAFNPGQPLLATRNDEDNVIHLWAMDFDRVFAGVAARGPLHYVNAKVVLVGGRPLGGQEESGAQVHD